MEKENKLTLTIEINDIVNYVLQQNGLPIVRDFCLKNETEADIENLYIKISTNIDLMQPFVQGIQILHTGEEIHLRNLKPVIKGDYLASLTERISCNMHVCVCKDETELISETKEITVLAYDEWPGLKYFPDLLASFVMPNHPVVNELLQSASKWLNKWTGDPSLEGYQGYDPNRVKRMAAAAYAAIQEKNITYAVPPSSFGAVGQRVRLADAVMDQHMGTCLDLTLLYVACLEAMGLNSFMVMMKGHIFAGVWLIDESFADPIVDDPSQLEKRMSAGINEVLVVECTMMCAGKKNDFENAVKAAVYSVGNYSNFVFAIDVLRARKSGVRPLPIRIKTDNGYKVEHEERKEEEITNAPDLLEDTFTFENGREKEQVTKAIQWERKLLDLSMRNMLINMRLTKAVVPLLASFVGDLEDALAEGEEFQVLPRPLEWEMAGVNTFSLETTNDLGAYGELIALECKHRKLHTIYTEKELNSTLTKMYRSAKTSMEENGASTLYLALGLLRWFESRNSNVPRYAPLVLIPIDIVRKSASKGYVLRMRDEDPQINITLLEFLKQNFDIRISGLNPLPLDEHGLDIKKIFATIRHGIMDEAMWDIIESGFIGNFSFSQFVMWNDIHSRPEILKRNKIVRSLMEGAVDWDCTIPESVNTDEAYLPITADSSQLRAINMAANDVSFVLHGPPGTGKSQTITAMIANALTKGKTILFVAEKMAALEVVQKRLAALGIGDFCLELHSNKAVKKNVLNQLKRGLEINVWGFSTEYDEKIADIRKMRKNLDGYVQKLHEKRRFGKSLREMIDLYEIVPQYDQELRFDRGYASDLSQSDLANHRHLLERLIAAGKAIGHPYEHPLYEIKQTIYTQSLKLDVEDTVSSYKKSLEVLQENTEAFTILIGSDIPVTEEEWKKTENYAACIIEAENIPEFLMESETIDGEFRTPYDYLLKKEKLSEKKTMLLERWNENFLRMDMDVLRKKYEEAAKKFFGKGKALQAIVTELQAYAAFKVETDQITVYLTEVDFYQKDLAELEELKNSFSIQWKQLLDKYDSVQALRAYESQIKKQLSVIAKFNEKIHQMKAEGVFRECISKAKTLISSHESMRNKETAVRNLLGISFDDADANWLKGRKKTCDRILEHRAAIKDWIVYRQFAKECTEAGLGVVCDAYEKGMPHEYVMDVYYKSIYKAIILSVIEQEPVLNSFTGTGFNERILQFKKLDQEFMELTKEEMFYKLTHNLPTGYESVTINKELNILRRAISSNGRGMSIRTLFDQIPHVLTKLCPCMLMSPISVAQFLSADNDLFDIVIFDEASQLPTCKAVGVLARGKNAVIVGDPNQMPPTSFFAGNTVDEENLDIEDLDSILDDCLALGMPQAHLQWHYRSRHESLIAFSNHEFYENSMLTFPSVNDREKRVKFVNPEGFFDRGKGRVNEGEAKAIIAEILRRYHDTELQQQTIGVVTFNISQQVLIEDLLQEELRKDAEFDNWANNREEALFVKNLENVQGDERDVILFSIAFGPDAEGKLSLNFGPLNKEGGWKRLNVAVSRARSEMVVFSSMTGDMIDLKRTKSKGVEALKNFLEFAEKGSLRSNHTERSTQKKEGILESICKELTDAGYKYQKAVGHSDFKVDIAVINPYNQDEYLLGIMLDGDSYRRSENTKDREVAQINVLQGLGWKLHRVWTLDWWDNREREIQKIMRLVEEQKNIAFEDADWMDDERLLDDNLAGVIEAPIQTEDTECVQEGQAVTELEMPEIEILAVKVDENSELNTIKIASKSQDEMVSVETDLPDRNYSCTQYRSVNVPVTALTTSEYIDKKSVKLIEEKLKLILEAEAPISLERLMRKTLRGFGINRSSAQTLEATEKVLKKMPYKVNRQNGMKFYWKETDVPDLYSEYRIDINVEDRRNPDEICQQELKNAACATLMHKGTLSKEELIKETIRTMGYGRSGKAIAEAVERGIKFGRKTGEIAIDDKKLFKLNG